MVLTGDSFIQSVVPNSAQVYRFDLEYNLDVTQVTICSIITHIICTDIVLVVCNGLIGHNSLFHFSQVIYNIRGLLLVIYNIRGPTSSNI